MLSRVADSVFWMARYMERTDNVLRILRTHYIASQDEILDFDWKKLTKALSTDMSALEGMELTYQNALRHLVLDKDHDASVCTNVVRARENARSVQDYITKELWQCLNDYYHLVRSPQTEELLLHHDPVTAFDHLAKESTLFYGTVDITMNRGEGYTFVSLGKYIERSLQALNVLELKLSDQVAEAVKWKYLLYSLSGYEFHTKFYKNALQTEEVIHQVLFNSQFPHSVIYSLQQAERYFKRLDSISIPDNFGALSFMIGKAVNDLRYSAQDLKQKDNLQELLNATRQNIISFSNQLAKLYFGYS
jgi:uncharacterized alpha-E superfamily protein